MIGFMVIDVGFFCRFECKIGGLFRYIINMIWFMEGNVKVYGLWFIGFIISMRVERIFLVVFFFFYL